MSRQEENKVVIEVITKLAENKSKSEATHEEVVRFHLSAIVAILGDISESLAIIADKAEKVMNKMDDKTALNGFKNLLNDIDKDNHLFVGTINPEMIKIAISAIESKLAGSEE